MMMEAIEDQFKMSNWLFNGGDATLDSYGLSTREWMQLEDKVSPLQGFVDFYKRLKPYHEDADAIYVHAGVDVTVTNMEEQKLTTLLWIRNRFINSAAKWPGKQIIFGHTPTHLLGMEKGEIYRNGGHCFGIDTGCVYGGSLTAIHLPTHKVYREDRECGHFQPQDHAGWIA